MKITKVVSSLLLQVFRTNMIQVNMCIISYKTLLTMMPNGPLLSVLGNRYLHVATCESGQKNGPAELQIKVSINTLRPIQTGFYWSYTPITDDHSLHSHLQQSAQMNISDKCNKNLLSAAKAPKNFIHALDRFFLVPKIYAK